MSKRTPELLLKDILDAIGRIAEYLVGYTQIEFLNDRKTVDAVIRNLEIIGEATRQLPVTFRERHSTIPWSQLAGMRNRIVHDYAGVDLELVWHITQSSIPELRIRIAEILESF